MIDNQYKGRLAILYDRILRHRKMTMEKSNTLWNINLNLGILMLFKNVAAQQPFAGNTGAFYNPKITKVEVTIEVTLQSRDARLSDVGRGKEVLCARQ